MSQRFSLLCLSACLLLACGNTGAPAQDYGPLLSNLSQQVILPEHRAFAEEADALVVAVQALADNPDADSLQAAQSAWRATRQAYRTLDALHFGPGYTLHLTERIDVAPADAGGIEQLVLGSAALDAQAVANAGGAKKGFLGLEYLLFGAAGEAESAPVLATDDAAARRRTLALSMAGEIASSAHELDDAWEPGKGRFATQIELAGAGGTQYATQRAAVDDLCGGVSYALEWIVGVRLAEPLGRKNGGMPAPELDPTSRSDSAVPDMQASLVGALALYADTGFSAVIRDKSAALDQSVLAEFEAGKSKLQAIPAPFADTVANQTALVQAAYDATQALKKTWNTDVSSALGATVKTSDNDGD